MIPYQMKIDVTWEDNLDGTPGKPTSCAIAKSINRLYPNLRYVRVTEREIRCTDKEKGLRYSWATPLTARNFIKNFDKNKDPNSSLTFYLRADEAEATPVKKSPSPEKSRASNAKYQARMKNESNREATLRERARQKKLERERRGFTS